MKRFTDFVFNSPTLMTWGSFLSRSLSVLVIAFVLRRFSPAEAALWLEFSFLFSFQFVIDAGFAMTFARLIALANGGTTDLRNPRDHVLTQPNWLLIEKIYIIMRRLYLLLNVLALLLIGGLGTLRIAKSIEKIPDASEGWWAWGIIVGVSAVYLQVNRYSAYLQGLNKVAELRRWEMFTTLGGAFCSLLALLFGGGLLEIVIINQLWVLAGIFRNRMLSYKAENGRLLSFKTTKIDSEVWHIVWQTGWRTAIGVFLSFGLQQILILTYSEELPDAQRASFLFALRIMLMITEFSQAPFYSKIPRMTSLYSEGKQGIFMGVAVQGLQRSHWFFTLACVLVGIFADFGLKTIGSTIEFPTQQFWALLSLAFFAQRYGAMLLNWYGVTNNIVWHYATMLSSVTCLIAFLFVGQSLEMFSFIAVVMAGNIVYAIYCAVICYRYFKISFFKFDIKVMLPPLFSLLLYLILVFIW